MMSLYPEGQRAVRDHDHGGTMAPDWRKPTIELIDFTIRGEPEVVDVEPDDMDS